jgi:hypothetical protein
MQMAQRRLEEDKSRIDRPVHTVSASELLGPSGLLAGVPAAGTEGTYTFRVRATDTNGCTSDRDYVLIIAGAVPVLPPGMLLVMALLLLAAGALVLRRRRVA